MAEDSKGKEIWRKVTRSIIVTVLGASIGITAVKTGSERLANLQGKKVENITDLPKFLIETGNMKDTMENIILLVDKFKGKNPSLTDGVTDMTIEVTKAGLTDTIGFNGGSVTVLVSNDQTSINPTRDLMELGTPDSIWIEKNFIPKEMNSSLLPLYGLPDEFREVNSWAVAGYETVSMDSTGANSRRVDYTIDFARKEKGQDMFSPDYRLTLGVGKLDQNTSWSMPGELVTMAALRPSPIQLQAQLKPNEVGELIQTYED